MKVRIGFRFGPVHTPLRRNSWRFSPVIKVKAKDKYFNLVISRPFTYYIHELEGERTQRIADSYIGLLVETEFPETSSDFRTLAESVVSSVSPLIEEFRINTKQPHLRLRHISDLESGKVQTLDGKDLPELTAKFANWMGSETGGRPLPYLSKEDWVAVIGESSDSMKVQEVQADRIPLHESLLLDAELALDSDPRIAIMFSALACEVFIQNWLGQRASGDSRLKYWLEWADPRHDPEKAVSLRTYFDLGLVLAVGKSMKEEKSLWKAFTDLINARNDVAHRGTFPGKFMPSNAVRTASQVISWVKCLQGCADDH